VIRARLQICTSSPLFNKDACGPSSALFCIVYPFREGRSAPSLTTKLPDQPDGGSSLAGRATPTRPGYFSSPGLVAAAAFKACTSGSPTCMGRLSNLGVKTEQHSQTSAQARGTPATLGQNPLTRITDGSE